MSGDQAEAELARAALAVVAVLRQEAAEHGLTFAELCRVLNGRETPVPGSELDAEGLLDELGDLLEGVDVRAVLELL